MPDLNGSVYDAVRCLLGNGKADNYVELVERNAPALESLVRAVERIQRVAPDVALSPYVNRALRLLGTARESASQPEAASPQTAGDAVPAAAA